LSAIDLWGIFTTSPAQQAGDVTPEVVTAAVTTTMMTVIITTTLTRGPPTNHPLTQGRQWETEDMVLRPVYQRDGVMGVEGEVEAEAIVDLQGMEAGIRPHQEIIEGVAVASPCQPQLPLKAVLTASMRPPKTTGM
jgi:hypothetical protein